MPGPSLRSGQEGAAQRLPPTGTVTFLFTDIEGSTHLLQQLGSRYADVLTEERRLLRVSFQGLDGHEIDTAGDGLFVAFGRATQAVSAAVAAQRAIASGQWPEGARVRVRMGLHTGEALLTAGGYVGLDVHRAARICSAGHGGQVIISQTTRDLVENDLPSGAGLLDVGEHRLKDLQRPERLFQVLIAGLPSDFPPLKSLDTLPNNLPVQLTSFIGREREISEVKRLLATTRLLTFTGSGGCGKTRLALQVAADVLEGYPNGVWFIELAPLSDPTLVPQAVAGALGLREQPGQPILATLSHYLQTKQMLLVLDNCEHLIGACASLCHTLLHSCPKLRILSASREALGIAGEVAWRVPSLSLPEPKHLESVEASALTQYEAVRLFIDRAVDALPTFRTTNRNAPAIAQICHRLDGIPLAIELAAARVKVLSAEEINARLDDRFRLLTGGSRTALPRQQTLRAAIDWSYNLLSDSEKVLLRRLSVFMGGWTLEAAEAICGDSVPLGAGAEVENDVLDLLTHLVEKSLVVTEEEGGRTRYRLLETIRQYARDKLLESDEAAALRERHRDWFLSLAEKAEPELHGPDQEMWFERLEAEHDNLRAGLEWSLGSGETEIGLRLAGAIHWFWFVRGYWSEGLGWLEEALAKGSSAPASLRAKALHGAGSLVLWLGDYDRATALIEESLALYQELGDKGGIARLRLWLGVIAERRGDYNLAKGLLEESLDLLRQAGDKLVIDIARGILGQVVMYQGDYGRAKTLFEEELASCRKQGDRAGIAFSLLNSAFLALNQGDYGRVVALCEESLALWRELGSKVLIPYRLSTMGLALLRQGDYERATKSCEEALSLAREVGNKEAAARSLHHLGIVKWYQEDYKRAEALFKEGIALSWEMRDKFDTALNLEGLAEVAVAEGQPERGARLFGAMEGLCETIGFLMSSAYRADYDGSVAAARAGLGEEAFAKAWEEGRRMTMEEAIQLAEGSEQ